MKKCENCGKEHDSSYATGRFCSKKCAKGFSTKAKRSLINEAVRKKLTKEKKFYTKICLCCEIEFKTLNKDRQYCGRKCSSKASYGLKTKDDIGFIYKQLCQFKFGLSSYSEEFNFNLINEYGWYKPKNHGDNLNGISRDHKLSIHTGYVQRINPYIISHPANCELKIHPENNKKNISNSITLNDLIKEIKKWNSKYNTLLKFKVKLSDEEIVKMYRRGA